MVIPKGYKQTEIGVIPEEWPLATLGDAFTKLDAGVSVNSDERSQSKYYVLKTSAVHDGFVDTKEIKPVVKRDYSRLKCPIKHSAIIISRMNTPALVGACGYVIESKQGTYLPDRLWQIENKKPLQYDFFWLNGLLNTLTYKDKIHATATGTSNSMKNIAKERLLEIVTPKPPLPEQQCIAEALSDADGLISSLKKLIDKKKAVKQGTMQQLLTGKTRLPGFSEEWVKKPLSKIADGLTMGQSPDSHYYNTNRFGIPLVQGNADIESRHAIIRFYTSKITKLANKGDILFTVRAPVGNVSKTDFDCCIGRGVCAIRGNDFLYQLLVFFEPQWKTVSSGSTFDSISGNMLSEVEFTITPNKEEQATIADVLSDMDSEIEALEKKLAKAHQIKQGMMQQLLTGKIRLIGETLVENAPVKTVELPKPEKKAQGHNKYFEDAVLIAAIVDSFYSDRFLLGRVKLQKLLYLLRRHQAVSVAEFKKKAAGPYADTVRYKGGEPIAISSKYIVAKHSDKGTVYSQGFNIQQALDYIEKWDLQADINWLKENFLHSSRNDLELFATVDMAMCDLQKVAMPVSIASIKGLIKSSKEWKAKLTKSYFSDADIHRAIGTCNRLFRAQ
ncbi:MAG: restriction endonuclease subunit S [Oscillospiraceae bacterium]|nr:restriction endonuclease subunit S [Oscillospiraceae bacterium]